MLESFLWGSIHAPDIHYACMGATWREDMVKLPRLSS